MNTSSTLRTLSLDLATVTGFALAASGIITSGSVCFRRKTGRSQVPDEHAGQPLLNCQRWLRERIQEDKPDEIVIERCGFVKSFAVRDLLIGLRAIVMLNAAYHQIPVFTYSPNHVKKFWSGNGNADKAVMVATTIARFPELAEKDIDDNECDALALLHLHLNQSLPCNPASPIG